MSGIFSDNHSDWRKMLLIVVIRCSPFPIPYLSTSHSHLTSINPVTHFSLQVDDDDDNDDDGDGDGDGDDDGGVGNRYHVGRSITHDIYPTMMMMMMVTMVMMMMMMVMMMMMIMMMMMVMMMLMAMILMMR